MGNLLKKLLAAACLGAVAAGAAMAQTFPDRTGLKIDLDFIAEHPLIEGPCYV